MADEAERKVRQWALRRNGDPITNADIVELVFAFADDQDANHDAVLDLIEQAKVERRSIDIRLSNLEDCWHEFEEHREETLHAFVSRESTRVLNEHLAKCHSDEVNFQQRLVWWANAKIGYIVISVVIAILVTGINVALNYLWFGHP